MNKLALLKSLAPGFLPLIIFVVADSIWGTRIGLIIAVAVGILEFLVSYFKEKIIDKFILLDLGLIVALGLVSIWLENEIFFKLKPALIELIFCIILGVSVLSPVNIMLLLSKRYLKNVELDQAQIKQLNTSLKVLLVIFFLHTLLIVYAAFFMSKQAWAFISGGLFYIIFGIYFAFEFLKNRIKQKKWLNAYKDEEWFDIVDEDGRVKGKAPRSVCHEKPGMLHPVIHMHVLNSRDQIYLQKRSKQKKIQPGKWDTAVGGHLSSGEKVEDALKREAEEEIGITDFKANFITKYVWETHIETELVFLFCTRYNRAITVNRTEIDDGKFWKIKKIRENLGKGIFSENFEFEFKILLKNLFKID
jgi:isopentenyldiphosphate isomerase/intracellular septation protein A